MKRCVQSVIDSGYDNWFIWCHTDRLEAFTESVRQSLLKDEADNYTIGAKYSTLGYRPLPPSHFHYNLYCNTLIRMPDEGYSVFLDDDDALIPGSLSKMAPYLEEDRPVICQMLRNGRPKPADIYMDKHAVVKGRIGMPCLVLHAKHKDLFTFPAIEDADYQWIKTISEQLDCKFIKIPLVDAGQRSHGQ